MVLKARKFNIKKRVKKNLDKSRFWKSCAQKNKSLQMMSNCNQPEAPDVFEKHKIRLIIGFIYL